MPAGTLDIKERFKTLGILQEDYLKAGRVERGQILDHLVMLTGQHRGSLSRRLHGSCERQARSQERSRSYGPAVDDAIRVISEAHDYICPERLQPNLVDMAEHLARHSELTMTDALRDQLGRISISTLRRTMKRLRQDEPQLRRRNRPPPSQRQGVPMRRIPWDEPVPGHLEVDLVHHCGPETIGEYLYTFHMVDVTTGWSEPAAILGRSFLVMRDAFLRCLARFPVPVREIHTDNGSEFFNDHLTRFFASHLGEAQRSRSRPYRKNDNRFVEHRNGDLIRAYLGDDRFDTAAQTLLLNAFYDKLWLYHNFFQPVLRLKSKTTSDDGQHVRREYSEARTPFARLCAAKAPDGESPLLSDQKRHEMEALRQATNPRQLRRELLALLQELWRLPAATPGRSEDALSTLFDPTVLEEGGGDPQSHYHLA